MSIPVDDEFHRVLNAALYFVGHDNRSRHFGQSPAPEVYLERAERRVGISLGYKWKKIALSEIMKAIPS